MVIVLMDMIKRINNIIDRDPEYADALSILAAYKAMLLNYYFLSYEGYFTAVIKEPKAKKFARKKYGTY